MAKEDESMIEKSAVAVSSGSLMLLALLLIADSKFGHVFRDLNNYVRSSSWVSWQPFPF
jgi:hypothetical protein